MYTFIYSRQDLCFPHQVCAKEVRIFGVHGALNAVQEAVPVHHHGPEQKKDIFF
jgi:hypothetical protein